MRCSQTHIHSALPFTAPPLLFVCRLPPIFIATQPVTNTVGYTTKTLEANSWYLIGSGFEGTDGNAFSIQEFITGLTAGSSAADAPTIQYWDGTKLATLYYINGALDSVTYDVVTAWADADTMSSTLSLDPCTGFWVKSGTGGTIEWKR